ncbi:hypothetical protein RND81_07G020300 [Saponaria officinalis]|uniref:Uncharacterized protein n=1 Tax=Saponaria officinalis TaxID=3572 RepID=A0AAW1JMT1_SAPOF
MMGASSVNDPRKCNRLTRERIWSGGRSTQSGNYVLPLKSAKTWRWGSRNDGDSSGSDATVRRRSVCLYWSVPTTTGGCTPQRSTTTLARNFLAVFFMPPICNSMNVKASGDVVAKFITMRSFSVGLNI